MKLLNKEKFEEIFNVKIKAAGLKYLEKIADEAPSCDELEEFNVPCEKLDEKIMAALKKFKKKLRRKRGFRIITISIVALFLLVVVSSITITSTEALRVKFNNLFVTDNGDNLELNASGSLDTDSLPEGSDMIEPGYLPSGFILVKADITTVSVLNKYLSTDNSTLIIIRSQVAGSIIVDNENCNNYETKINGNTAIVSQSDALNAINYFSNNYHYHIIGEGVDIEQLIKIAENLPK